MTTAPFLAISTRRKVSNPAPPQARPPAEVVRDALRFLRASESWDTPISEQFLTPALIVARERNRSSNGTSAAITGIEAHMLKTGLEMLYGTRAGMAGRGTLDALLREIKAQRRGLIDALSKAPRELKRHSAAFKGDVAKANARILYHLNRFRQRSDDDDCVKEFALDCIEGALRTKAWAKGAYRRAPCHPLDDIVHSNRHRWLIHSARPGKLRAADLGAAEARFVLQSLQDTLDQPHAQRMDAVRITMANVPVKMRAKVLDNCLRRCLDTPRSREESREALAQLLIAAGARTETVDLIRRGQALTRGNILNAIQSIVGPRAATDLNTALHARSIAVDMERGQSQLGAGGFGEVFTGTMDGIDIAYKRYPERRRVVLGKAYQPVPRRPSLVNASYARDVRHLVLPIGYLVSTPHLTDTGSPGRVTFIDRQHLRPYLKQQTYTASIRQIDQHIEVLADVQPRVFGRTLAAMQTDPQHRLSAANLKAMIRQGVATLKELDRNGLVHGDIKPQNMMWGDDGVLRLIDVDYMRKHHAAPLRSGGLGGALTAGYSTPSAALHFAHAGADGLARADKDTAPAQDYYGMAISLLRMQLPASMNTETKAFLDQSARVFDGIVSEPDSSTAYTLAQAGARTLVSHLDELKAAYASRNPHPGALSRVDFLCELAKTAVKAEWVNVNSPLAEPKSAPAWLAALLAHRRFRQFASR